MTSPLPDQGLLRLLYVSSSTAPFSDEDLVALLGKARRNNHAAGITGMLLHQDGNWMQLLEGAPETVRALYRRIRADRRHQGVTTLLEEPATQRLFAQWSMGFRALGPVDRVRLPGYSDFMTSSRGDPAPAHDATGCLEILQMFRDG